MDPKVIEWEEEKEEEAAGGKLKSGCEKLKKNSNYHDRMMPVENVLRIMDVLDVDDIVKQYPSALTKDDAVLLKDRRRLINFKRVTDAVVKLRVKKTGGNKKTARIRPSHRNDIFEFAVLTNFHNVKQENAIATKTDEQLVNACDIEVIFFYDSEECFREKGVTCGVSEISRLCSIDLRNNTVLAEVAERLDFAILYIRRPNKQHKMDILSKLKPLLFDETVRVNRAVASLTRLCIIGHPHGAYKHIAFGELMSDTNGLWREWETTGSRKCIEHRVATCPGSSGSPVIMMAINKEDDIMNTGLPFFQFPSFSR
ncbi:hypothetical protein OS493_031533 [Desmophyllum pertusum]|uniref:Uncharacterized protein n=1 Tax=Desmophyllum pertusum TaxID=174260 RepID=A0A9W9Z8A2_9CNID|nr:hypothetical protein OS493_031533 [Desmophyllum pertusum]